MPPLIQNAVYIPEADMYLVSKHTHDYQSYKFKNGDEIAVDGGPSYSRRVWSGQARENVVDFNISADASFDEIAPKLLWGSRGKNGDQPLTYKPLCLCEKDHLQAILDNCPYADPIVIRVIKALLS